MITLDETYKRLDNRESDIFDLEVDLRDLMDNSRLNWSDKGRVLLCEAIGSLMKAREITNELKKIL